MMENLIQIERFDYNTGIVYFRYLGETEQRIKVRLSSKNLTLHYDEFILGPGKEVLYYVGFNSDVLERVSNVDVILWNDNFTLFESFKLRDSIKIFDLPEFASIIEDPSYYSFDEVFNKEIYENKLIRINEGDIVVDIGGNYGFFSLYAKHFMPSKIITFEPSKSIFSHLSKNFTSGTIIQKAVSGKGGIQKFSENSFSSAASQLNEDGGYEVEVIGINDLLQTLDLERIDFLKIDCEGAEKEIFEEINQETISRINKIVVEFHSEEIREKILNKLNLLGFVVERVTEELIFSYNQNYYKNKKKIALISTYCDTQEKKDIFLELVKKVKSLGIDVIAISPLPLDKEHIEACDYLYFTKENPILGWPTRLFTFWMEYPAGPGRILTFQRGVGDYSWAALYHVKKLTQIAMDYDYDIFYHMIYDLEIDENVERALKDFEGNIVYPRRDPHHPETLWETTLHLMSFDRDLMKKIEKEITLEEYLSTNGVAEGEVYKWKKKFKLHGSEFPVRDKIYYWKDYDFFDYSPVKDFKMFISKNEPMDIWLGEGDSVYKEILLGNLKVVFYGNENIEEIELVIDGEEHKFIPEAFQILDLPIDSKKIQEIKLRYRGEEYDLSSDYEKIMLNQIYFNYKSS
jgi:FkbM family methyltransferase